MFGEDLSIMLEENKPKFYWIDSNYNNFLRGIDPNVCISEKSKKNRPSVSIGIKLNGHDYVIPLTSQYDSSWNNMITIKIKEDEINQNGKTVQKVISCLKLNNMHPALESQLIYIEFDKLKDSEYQRLVYKEYDYIKQNIATIIKKATKVHSMGTNEHSTNSTVKFIKKESVDFKLLEANYTNFDPTITYPKIP